MLFRSLTKDIWKAETPGEATSAANVNEGGEDLIVKLEYMNRQTDEYSSERDHEEQMRVSVSKTNSTSSRPRS